MVASLRLLVDPLKMMRLSALLLLATTAKLGGSTSNLAVVQGFSPRLPWTSENRSTVGLVAKSSILNSRGGSSSSPNGDKSVCPTKTALLSTTSASTLEEAKVVSIATTPISGMKPGTSGLRKKVEIWQGIDNPEVNKYYVENFIQALLDAAKEIDGVVPKTYVFPCSSATLALTLCVLTRS
jgi:hypothetical protein